jgi:hypothetical protein
MSSILVGVDAHALACSHRRHPEQIVEANMRQRPSVFGERGPDPPLMAAQGHGAVVNISSIAGQIAMPGMSVYGATKAALVFLTKSWAAEFGPQGVRVNAVVVGPTRTPGSAELGDFLDALAAQAPAQRVADPNEIAGAVAFLASENASFINGAALPADGGCTARLRYGQPERLQPVARVMPFSDRRIESAPGSTARCV